MFRQSYLTLSDFFWFNLIRISNKQIDLSFRCHSFSLVSDFMGVIATLASYSQPLLLLLSSYLLESRIVSKLYRIWVVFPPQKGSATLSSSYDWLWYVMFWKKLQRLLVCFLIPKKGPGKTSQSPNCLNVKFQISSVWIALINFWDFFTRKKLLWLYNRKKGSIVAG